MTYKALDVAHLILEKDPGERPMTRFRLLKLTYITHGFFLGWHHRRLIKEDVEAWRNGPVIYTIHDYFQDYPDGKTIPTGEEAPNYQSSDGSKDKLKADANKFITKVVDTYAHQTGRDMSALTHKGGTPWYNTVIPFSEAGFKNLPRHLIIPADYIEDYYTKLFERQEEVMGR